MVTTLDPWGAWPAESPAGIVVAEVAGPGQSRAGRQRLGKVVMNRSASSQYLFFAAAGALALSTVLPWVTISGEDSLAGVGWSTRPSTGGVLYLLLFATAYAGAGRALRLGREIRRWAIGMWVVNAWMAVNVIAISSSLKHQHVEDPFHIAGFHSGAGIGMVVGSLAVAAGIAGSVTLLRAVRPATGALS
jgi:hypothetical protein